MRDESRDLLLDSEDLANAVVGKEDLVFVREANRGWGPGAGNLKSTGVRYVPFEQYQKIEALVRCLLRPLGEADDHGLLKSNEQIALDDIEGLVK